MCAHTLCAHACGAKPRNEQPAEIIPRCEQLGKNLVVKIDANALVNNAFQDFVDHDVVAGFVMTVDTATEKERRAPPLLYNADKAAVVRHRPAEVNPRKEACVIFNEVQEHVLTFGPVNEHPWHGFFHLDASDPVMKNSLNAEWVDAVMSAQTVCHVPVAVALSAWAAVPVNQLVHSIAHLRSHVCTPNLSECQVRADQRVKDLVLKHRLEANPLARVLTADVL